ncbi:hydrogenase maturation nickel metallochaperone HypA [Candidatus Aminicenantes bacterium AC-335-B20]|jgi:hydrogenase nickel incorporation protein HypA/HybF|nr:hydrogenase maturation nickel metallochaperone HypA [SCandidatus Aminicenantes bacterium Aminicenantia_JdfR_composite]MCP2596614.1 hydrogenase maturation nickel metallochaperone HypA [Candidatus Aminicenantes bacterium AC-335-G13]MCP2598060.1 hydrogenase maturation nickel metallochaperone HypA [Candidatus Aminicenantes bacterium AC-335-L06]MCP2598972.1 hydrogenase maturation nickel metallochaperone HypA [Candidatus Aminicenantes bacterium AC-335-B20]MCP2605894.1 hydrogenase maturation nickel
MHELSIVANLFEILKEKAKEQKAKRITKVKLKVGVLSGVVPELLESAFDIYKKKTIASEAKLEIEKTLVKVKCQSCGFEFSPEDFTMICPSCGSFEIKILSGDELLLEKMELEI